MKMFLVISQPRRRRRVVYGMFKTRPEAVAMILDGVKQDLKPAKMAVIESVDLSDGWPMVKQSEEPGSATYECDVPI